MRCLSEAGRRRLFAGSEARRLRMPFSSKPAILR